MRAITIFLVLFFFSPLLALRTYAGVPTDQVRQTVDDVIDILKTEELKRPEKTKERRETIRRVVGNRFNFEEMAKRSLARHWRKRSPEEKKEFVTLYSDLLEKTYIKKIESYEDEDIFYIGESINSNYAVVKTKVITKKDIEIPIDYRLLRDNEQWLVYDVIVEGVSLVNNYRNQFSKIIRSNSYEELIERMKSKQE